MKMRKVGRRSNGNRFNSIEEKYKSYIEDEQSITKETKEVLRDWVNERRGNRLKDKATIGVLGTLINIFKEINPNVLEIKGKKGKQQVQEFFHKSSLKDTTELWYKKCLKRFFFWLGNNQDNSEYLLVISWIDTRRLSGKCSERTIKKREDNIPSPQEVRKMVSGCRWLRDKLAIGLLSNCGVRAETIGCSDNQRSINIGQVEFHKGYAIIKDIEEKFDKKRDVIVTESLSYLIKYWNEHPFTSEYVELKNKRKLNQEEQRKLKELSKEPLFICYAKNRRGKRWGYSGLKDMLHEVSLRTIGRIINPHDFRHLVASRLSLDDNLSDESKMKLMGWRSRRMLDRYTHTTFDDAKKEYLTKKGIIKVEDGDTIKVESSILKPRECLVCNHINSSTDSICEKCGNSLNYEKMIKDFTEKKSTNINIQKLGETMEMLQKELKELKRKND